MDEEKITTDEDLSLRSTPTAQDDRSWTFDLSALFLAVFGAVIMYHGFMRFQWEFLLVGVITLIASVTFLVWPEVLRRRSQDIKSLNESLRDLKDVVGDVESVRKEHNKARAAFDRSREVWESGGSKLVESITNFTQQLGGVSKYEQQLIQVRQEAGELSRQIDLWREISIEFIDFIDRTLSHAELNEEYRAAMVKTREQFVRKLAGVGITEINPKPGSEFDDRLHHAEGVRESDSYRPGSIVAVAEVGFATGNRILRPAKVWVAPEN